MIDKSIQKYLNLRNQIDLISDKLLEIHKDNIVCSKGCDDCCLNLKVFAVEFYAILNQLTENGVKGVSFDSTKSCGFLKNGLCSIYPYRPIICRTHGLPIVFSDSETGLNKSVSFCPKNFTMADFEQIEFGSDNTINIDEINEILCQINLEFLKENTVETDEYGRIDLKKIADMV